MSAVTRITGTLRPEDTKSFRRIPLRVDPGVSSIRIRFSYGPREEASPERGEQIALSKLEEYGRLLERLGEVAVKELSKRKAAIARSVLPLRNLLNFCLYDPEGGFRGRWDSPQYFGAWIEVSEDRKGTSRGFLPGPIDPGEWYIEIETHAVVTDECTYELEIEMPKAAPPAPGWWKGELHLHTNHSDGKAPLWEMVAAAKERGLDFIVLSDHNTVSAHADIAAMEFPIIPGMELTTYYGHAVAMGVRSFIDWREPADSTLSRPIREVHAQGGLFSIAHPFTIGDPICTGCEWKYENVDLHQVDLLEVWSGSWRKGWAQNALAFDWWNRLLNEGYRIIGVAARDVHDPKQFRIADTADTWVWAESPQPEAILKGLKSGRVFASTGPALDLSVDVEGRRFEMGSEVPATDAATLRWTCRIDGLSSSAELWIVRNGRPWQRFPIDETGSAAADGDGSGTHVRWDEQQTGSGEALMQTDWTRADLYRVDPESPDGRALIAFTNPIWVQRQGSR